MLTCRDASAIRPPAESARSCQPKPPAQCFLSQCGDAFCGHRLEALRGRAPRRFPRLRVPADHRTPATHVAQAVAETLSAPQGQLAPPAYSTLDETALRVQVASGRVCPTTHVAFVPQFGMGAATAHIPFFLERFCFFNEVFLFCLCGKGRLRILAQSVVCAQFRRRIIYPNGPRSPPGISLSQNFSPNDDPGGCRSQLPGGPVLCPSLVVSAAGGPVPRFASTNSASHPLPHSRYILPAMPPDQHPPFFLFQGCCWPSSAGVPIPSAAV